MKFRVYGSGACDVPFGFGSDVDVVKFHPDSLHRRLHRGTDRCLSQVHGSGWFRVEDVGCRVLGLGLRGLGFGVRVYGLWFMVYGLWFSM